jgi:hypothetical protein
MSLFAKQKKLKIWADATIDLSTASNPKIIYIDPAGHKGFWPGTIEGTNVTYEIQAADNILVGVYNVQAYAEIGGQPVYGEIKQLNFLETLDS